MQFIHFIAAAAAAAVLLSRPAQAHGDHGDHEHHYEQQPLAADADWATRHMSGDTNEWTRHDIATFYGLNHESNNHVSASDKEAAVDKVVELYDRDRSGTVSFAEYILGEARGIKLPDLGYGPGHHGDDEYEYEIHHFEKFHGEGTTEEDLIHPEDIEHFKMHDRLDEQEERQEKLDAMSIVEENIPQKFRRA